MTPEQIDEIVADYCMVDTSVSGGFDDVGELIAIINQLQEQVASYEDTASYLSGLSTDQADELMAENKELQEQVTELENHNKDKSQLLANYKEQIKELVKQKYRGEE